MITRKLNLPTAPCKGGKKRLRGGDIVNIRQYRKQMQDAHGHRMDAALLEHLIRRYGSRFYTVWERIRALPGGRRPLCSHRDTLAGEIPYFVEHEMALTLEDVVFRRSGLGTVGHPGNAVIRRVGQLMARPLGWSRSQFEDQIQQVQQRYIYH
jgi:glycerol-3-phosphate dehydrogenase